MKIFKRIVCFFIPLVLCVVSGSFVYAAEKSELPSQAYLEEFMDKAKNKVGFVTSMKKVSSGSAETNFSCIGTLIGDQYVLTSAFCAYDSVGDKVAHIYFHPGFTSLKKIDLGKYRVLKVYHPKDFFDGNSFYRADSVAVMKIGLDRNKKAGNVVGTAGFWGRRNLPTGDVLVLDSFGDIDNSKIKSLKCKAFSATYIRLKCKGGAPSSFLSYEGMPIFVYSPEHNNLFVHGFVSGRSTNDLTFSGINISPERYQIIKYIRNGEFGSEKYKSENFSEKWISFKPPHNDIVEVWVRNRCNSTRYVAVKYKNINGEWLTKGYYKLRPKSEMPMFHSRNGIYYLHVSRDDDTVLTDKDIYFDRRGEKLSFQKYNTKKFGSFTHTFDCKKEIDIPY